MEIEWEVSYSVNIKLFSYIANQTDEDRSECRDPFDILAEREEEAGTPLIFNR